MKQSDILAALVLAVAVGAAGAARAGAPTPDIREGDFQHVCKGGPNKTQPCTVANEATDCPKGECVLMSLGKTVKGTLTIIADDFVLDWAQGFGSPRALTIMLEVKAADGTKHLLADTYQNLNDPTQPPELTSSVVSIGVDEAAVKTLATQVSGLMFAQPEASMAQDLRTLLGATGTPVLVELKDKTAQFTDGTGDGLASVLRCKVKIQFFNPV